jgi:hypothetical protein
MMKEMFGCMKNRCIWEHNGNDTLLLSESLIGAFTRGASLDIALSKMEAEAASYLKWRGAPAPEAFETEVIEEKASTLNIGNADSDVIFASEKGPLTSSEYHQLKGLALKSARDFEALYQAIPDKSESCLPHRKTFYGQAPRTAKEMYEHTKNVNAYYFGEIGVSADNQGDMAECRQRGFAALEKQPHFLDGAVHVGSYDEAWSLRKVIRRFLWHDRIHAKAMYRMALKTFGEGAIPDIFFFDL